MIEAKFKDLRHFEAWKITKKHQGIKIEEIQAKSERAQKSEYDTGVYDFFRTDRVWLGFKI
jgi:hypothetical protein